MDKETQMMLVPQGSIEGYIRAANEYPMLTEEEEKELAERLYYHEDLVLSRGFRCSEKTHFVASSFRDPCCTWLFWLWFASS